MKKILVTLPLWLGVWTATVFAQDQEPETKVITSRQQLYMHLRDQMPTVVVNGATITHGMVGERMYQLRRQEFFDVHKKYENLPPPQYRDLVREKLIDEVIAYQGAMAAGVTVDASTVIEEARKFLGSDPEQARERMSKYSIELESFADRAVVNLLIDRFRDLLASEMPEPTTEEMREFYNANREVFEVTPEMFLVRKIEIVKPNEVKLGDPKFDEIRNRAEEILQRVKSGEDFATLADRLTEDPDGIGKGGSMGWLNRVTSGSELFWNMLHEIEVGSIMGELGYLPGRWVILKVEDRKEPVYIPFEEVIPRVKKGMEIQYLKDWIETQKKNAKIVYYENLTQGQVLKGEKPKPTYLK